MITLFVALIFMGCLAATLWNFKVWQEKPRKTYSDMNFLSIIWCGVLTIFNAAHLLVILAR